MKAAPTPRHDIAPQEPLPTSAAPARRLHLIINAGSGLARHQSFGDRARAYLTARGVQTDVDVAGSGEELHDIVSRSAGGRHDIVVAAGGDGTISAVASAIIDTGQVLGVIPLGTFNYFAQRLGVPLDPERALGVLASGRIRTVTVGEVNGRIFLNNSSIGLYPAVLRQRESTYRRFGRGQLLAYLSAAVTLARPPAHLNLELDVDGTRLLRRSPLLFIGTNPQQLESFGLQGTECVNAGQLAMYITHPLGARRLWTLALGGLLNGFDDVPGLETVCGNEAIVTTRRPRVRVAIDGEIVRLRGPLRYRSRPDALRVLVPAI
jgi:diacylglycerol kinase family enzyme